MRPIFSTLIPLGLLILSPSTHAWPAAQPRPLPPVAGPHIGLSAAAVQDLPSFHAAEPLVLTYYFYWYDAGTKAHFLNPDGSDALTTHPVDPDLTSYRSVAWHKSQLRDMIAAGIDVVLPVYWGTPADHEPGSPMYWSIEGLKVLVQAWDELDRAGETPPRIGLFYDTSTLQANRWNERINLTNQRGHDWFYATVRDFFSLVPPRMWALVDGRPIVSLYSASFALAHDQSAFDALKARFPADFGGLVPYVIREVSWRAEADATYAWGGAVEPRWHSVAAIGPGYDHSAVPGREPLVVSREGGAFYDRAWRAVLRRRPSMVAIETWNEFHEGTDIAESREYGRQYIEMTRLFADRFHRGEGPPPPLGPHAGAPSVAIALADPNRESGLLQVEWADGRTRPTTIAGKTGRMVVATEHGGRYVYFRVDESFKWAAAMDLVLEVEYLDQGTGWLGVEYDAHDPNGTAQGAFTSCGQQVRLNDTGRWQTAAFRLPAARLSYAQHDQTDLRLAVGAPSIVIHGVVLRRASE